MFRRKNKTVTLDNGIKLTPLDANKPDPLPKELMAVPGLLAGEWVAPGHIDFYDMPDVGWIAAQYHGLMPSGDVILTIKKLAEFSVDELDAFANMLDRI